MNDGGKIDELNQALARFKEDVCKDELSAQRVDVCIISFNGEAKVTTPFCPIEDFNPPKLKAYGATCMGKAIELALRTVEQRTHDYHQLGIECYAPFVLMLTDGEPTDLDIYDYEKVRRHIDLMENEGRYGHLKFHAFGVEGADLPFLLTLTKRVLAVRNNAFSEVFRWVSESMEVVSRSKVGEKVKAPKINPAYMVPAKEIIEKEVPWSD